MHGNMLGGGTDSRALAGSWVAASVVVGSGQHRAAWPPMLWIGGAQGAGKSALA
jgi:hypothetical protein